MDALDASPTFTRPLLASEHLVHRGGIADTPSGKFCGNGTLGDFLTLRVGPQGEAAIAYADSNNAYGVFPGLNDPNGGQLAHPMFVRQTGGTTVYADATLLGRAPATSRVTDPRGDARSNLDVLGASVSRRGTAFRIVLRVADLRTLKPRGSDATLVWLAQWFSPSRTDPEGGKNLFVCMTSTKGGKPAFWLGETSGQVLPTNAPGFAYPAERRVKGSYVRGAPGTITIDLPSKLAYDANPIAKTLYSVTASTLTLVGNGPVFALADSAPSFDFVP